MFVIVAVFQTAPGREAEFETIMNELVIKVRETESDVVYFDFCRHGQQPGVYSMIEKYATEAALNAHGQTPHFQELTSKLDNILNGPPQFNLFQQIA